MTITKEFLKKLYYENENKVVCKKLGITNPTLMSYLKYYNIKPKGKGSNKTARKITLA